MNLSHELLQQPDLEVVSKLGQGSFASVYKVNLQRDKKNTLQIARVLKNVKDHHALKREKDLLHYLNQHKELFPRFNEIRKDGFNYIQLFDYVGDKTLEKFIKKQGGLCEKEVRFFLKKMLLILEKVHSVGFVHADVKPDNIIVGGGGVKSYILIDWSQAIPSLSSYETELMIGDKKYSPPERLNGEYTEAGDTYSLGCTLYYVITGKHIYGLEKVEDKIARLFAQATFAPIKLPSISEKWFRLIVWMTHKNPKKRPSLLEIMTWLATGDAPKITKESFTTDLNQFPDNCLDALAKQNYYYAIFKKAITLEENKEFKLAYQSYEKLAFKGYSRAENNIAKMLERGQGVKQSFSKAMFFYNRSIKKGNPFAAGNLGRFYRDGNKGATKNLPVAFKLIYFAAMRGRHSSQTELGKLYLTGTGVVKNKDKAIFWLELAAVNGDKKAKNILFNF